MFDDRSITAGRQPEGGLTRLIRLTPAQADAERRILAAAQGLPLDRPVRRPEEVYGLLLDLVEKGMARE